MIKVDEEQLKEWEWLLCKGGLRFELKSGMSEEVQFERDIPDWSTLYHVNNRLHVCGGETEINGKIETIADFFSLSVSGRSKELAPMIDKRQAASLSGVEPVPE